MNFVQLLTAFIPWILFGLISGPTMESLTLALFVGLLSSILLGYRTFRKMYILSVATVVFFVTMIIAIVVFRSVTIAELTGVLSYGWLSAVIWGSLLFSHPFTLDYSRESVDPERQKTRGFMRINQILTATWGCLLSINLGVMILIKLEPETAGIFTKIIPWALLVLGLVFTIRYPGFARSREKTVTG